ncbi:hypothetical protein CON26_30720 [Bacillus cereus]|nr:hypothetical protein CON26_30720 [Bacillus cereus]
MTKGKQTGIVIYWQKLVGEPIVVDEAHRVVGDVHIVGDAPHHVFGLAPYVVGVQRITQLPKHVS